MNLAQDFKEFIELLNAYSVRYLLVGGYALSFFSRPKLTQDIDFWIDPEAENAEKVLKVLEEFGFGQLDITMKDLSKPGQIIQLGNAPLRIDLLTAIDGVNFTEAYRNKVNSRFLGIDIDIISRSDLIKNKQSSGRKKDLADLDWLEQYG